jgi:folate-binding protein YgfZ
MTLERAYEAASTAAVLMDRSSEGRLEITGRDRATWLQGLLTNDIEALAPGEGCYAAYLTPQGRMVSDMRVLALDDRFLLDLPAARRRTVLERFVQFLITEDVAIEDVTQRLARLGLHGARAAEVLVGALDELRASDAARLATLPEHHHVRCEAGEIPVLIAGSREIGRHGFDLYFPAESFTTLLEALSASGVADIDADTWDTLRIEAGRPLFGVDMDTETIPLEAGIEDRAISLTKGCYVGQEIIIRVLHRGGGRVARRLVGLAAEPGNEREGRLEDGQTLYAGDREVGRLTSTTFSPAMNRAIALGYVHRDFVDPGTRLDAGREPPVTVTVTELPFTAGAARLKPSRSAPDP